MKNYSHRSASVTPRERRFWAKTPSLWAKTIGLPNCICQWLVNHLLQQPPEVSSTSCKKWNHKPRVSSASNSTVQHAENLRGRLWLFRKGVAKTVSVYKRDRRNSEMVREQAPACLKEEALWGILVLLKVCNFKQELWVATFLEIGSRVLQISDVMPPSTCHL